MKTDNHKRHENRRIGNASRQGTHAVKAGLLFLFIAMVLVAAPSCSLFGGGEEPDQEQAAPARPARRLPKETKKAPDSKEESKGPRINDALIKEAELDSIKSGFNKDVGREDPFEAVSFNTGTGDFTIMAKNPEMYRVIGLAHTPDGPVAMLQMDNDSPIVHEGDILDSGATVKKITQYTVVLENNGEEYTMGLRTRKRTALSTDDAMKKQMENLPQLAGAGTDSLFDTYLKQKYSQSDTGGGEMGTPGDTTSTPKSFPEFLEKNKSGTGTEP